MFFFFFFYFRGKYLRQREGYNTSSNRLYIKDETFRVYKVNMVILSFIKKKNIRQKKKNLQIGIKTQKKSAITNKTDKCKEQQHFIILEHHSDMQGYYFVDG